MRVFTQYVNRAFSDGCLPNFRCHNGIRHKVTKNEKQAF